VYDLGFALNSQPRATLYYILLLSLPEKATFELTKTKPAI